MIHSIEGLHWFSGRTLERHPWPKGIQRVPVIRPLTVILLFDECSGFDSRNLGDSLTVISSSFSFTQHTLKLVRLRDDSDGHHNRATDLPPQHRKRSVYSLVSFIVHSVLFSVRLSVRRKNSTKPFGLFSIIGAIQSHLNPLQSRLFCESFPPLYHIAAMDFTSSKRSVRASAAVLLAGINPKNVILILLRVEWDLMVIAKKSSIVLTLRSFEIGGAVSLGSKETRNKKRWSIVVIGSKTTDLPTSHSLLWSQWIEGPIDIMLPMESLTAVSIRASRLVRRSENLLLCVW